MAIEIFDDNENNLLPEKKEIFSLPKQELILPNKKLILPNSDIVVPERKIILSNNNIVAAPVKDYTYDEENEIYSPIDITFVNTEYFSEAAKHFKKWGCYTKAHPVYDKYEYLEYWKEERRRRIQGYTVGGVTITGEHYGFLNYGQILMTTEPDEIREAEIGAVIKNPKNKRNVAIKEIGFPDFWDGHYKWFKYKKFARSIGKHAIGGKARRKGYSYVGGWGGANVIDLYPNKTVVLGAFDTAYLTKGDGIMTMAKNYLDLINKNTAWTKRRIKNDKEHVKLGYKLKGRDEEYGFKSQIIAVSFNNNPDAAIGKDAYEINLEEVGKFPNLQEALDVTIPTLEDGSLVTGQIIAWGTGGSKDSNWEVFEQLFYNPKSQGFLACDNVWDDGAKGGESGCGFFFPHIQNLRGFIDKDGNSKLKEAAEFDEAQEAKHKKNATNVASHLQWRAQRANKPNQAFNRNTNSIFASPELSLHIKNLETNPDLKYFHRAGQLIKEEGKAVTLWTNDKIEQLGHKVHPPVFSFPHKPDKEDVHGCFVEWFSPFRVNGKVPKGLYRIWVDPVAFNKNKEFLTTRDSLQAMYVFERINNLTPYKGGRCVASFVGRPPKTDTFNEVVLRAWEYYGGEPGMVLFENDRGNLKEYAERVRKLVALADEPSFDFKKELRSTKTGREKGIMMNDGRKGHGAIYLRDWLYTQIGVDRNGNAVFNFHNIYDVGYLKELEKWNMKGNFDRTSAWLVGMFDIQEQFDKEIKMPLPTSTTNFFGRNLFTN